MIRLARVVLYAYPRRFRREFGAEWLRTVDDQRRHGGRSGPSVLVHLLVDTVLTAPRLRWENSMPKLKIAGIVLGTIVALFALVLGAGVILMPAGLVVGVIAISAQHHDRPIADEALEWGRRWYLWIAAAAVCFVIGGSMLFTEEDGGLASIAWLVWILSWLAAAVLAVIGLGLGANRLLHQRRA